jgi:hypothetical protein
MEPTNDFFKANDPILTAKLNDFLGGFNESVNEELKKINEQLESLSAIITSHMD